MIKTYIIRIRGGSECLRFAIDLDEDELRGAERIAAISESMAEGYEPRLEIWSTEKEEQ